MPRKVVNRKGADGTSESSAVVSRLRRKRRMRLTLAPKAKRKPESFGTTGVSPHGGDRARPSDEEWLTMASYPGFREDRGEHVSDDEQDEDGNDSRRYFSVGDIALLVPDAVECPSNAQLHDYWAAKILEVRAHPDTSDMSNVWVRIQWYYSVADTEEAFPKITGSVYHSKYERYLSDHIDLQRSSTFEKVIHMYDYDEISLSPIPIPHNSFFTRGFLNTLSGTIRPRPTKTCICDRPYNPDTDLMYFCPRPTCRRVYHRSCLCKSTDIRENCIPGLRCLNLMSASPDFHRPEDLLRYLGSAMPKYGWSATESATDDDQKIIAQCRANMHKLPDELLDIASSSIVRGEGISVTGNVRAVIEARRMVYGVMVDGGELGEYWKERIGDVDQEVKIAGMIGKQDQDAKQQFRCPRCFGAI